LELVCYQKLDDKQLVVDHQNTLQISMTFLNYNDDGLKMEQINWKHDQQWCKGKNTAE